MRQGETDAAETLFDKKFFKIAKFISKLKIFSYYNFLYFFY